MPGRGTDIRQSCRAADRRPGMLTGSLLIAWVLLNHSGTEAVGIGALPGHPKEIAQLLFHNFLLPFEVTSVLVLIAILGGGAGAKPEPEKKEN